MANFFTTIFFIFVILLLWLFLGMIITIQLRKLNWYNNLTITYRFKIPQRYLTKCTPIYELVESEWDSNRLRIRKWSLQYHQKEIHDIISCMFFFIPIQFLTYGYVIEGVVEYFKKDELEEKSTESLEASYERIWGVENEYRLKKLQVTNRRKEIIDNLNKTFNDNYEK